MIVIIIMQSIKSGMSGAPRITKSLIVEIVFAAIVITLYILTELTDVMTGQALIIGNNVCKFIF